MLVNKLLSIIDQLIVRTRFMVMRKKKGRKQNQSKTKHHQGTYLFRDKCLMIKKSTVKNTAK